MECYEGTTINMPIKTFRGLLTDGAQQIIHLHTNNGAIGYRIKKFQIITRAPGAEQVEHVVKIYKIKQTAVDGVIDFSDQTLLGAAEYAANDNGWTAGSHAVIFDNELVNQDIYVTGIDINGSYSVNYYIELEQMKLDLNENTVATLKDIRNVTG